MQRRATKNTRGPTADEKRFLKWVKEQPCCICGIPGPSIVDHMYGSTFRHNKVLIGMWALLPYCPTCDSIKTQGSRRAHNEYFGVTQADLFVKLIEDSPIAIPEDVKMAIADWGR